jgi:hypothetical protein
MQEKAMEQAKERRKTPRKAAAKAGGETSTARKRSTTAKAQAPVAQVPSFHEEQPQVIAVAGLRPDEAPEDLRRQIEEAAYFRAKQRGFLPGQELDDWVAAESEVMRRHGMQ